MTKAHGPEDLARVSRSDGSDVAVPQAEARAPAVAASETWASTSVSDAKSRAASVAAGEAATSKAGAAEASVPVAFDLFVGEGGADEQD
jgi:hypothetical protein